MEIQKNIQKINILVFGFLEIGHVNPSLNLIK